jgi:Phage protein Gp138 N-terminal domain
MESLQDLLISSFENQSQGFHTAIPCMVINVRDGLNGQMVDIQPTINQKFQDGTVAERPAVLGIPVSFPVSSTAGMTFPIKNGTTGLAVFSMRSMDAWKAGNGKPSTPLNFAKMDKGDAIFIPGIQPPGMAVNNPAKHVLTHNTNDTVMFANLGATECEVRLKADGSVEINTSNMPVTINCSDANINATGAINLDASSMTVDVPNCTWIGNITLQGNLNQTGNYTMNGVATFNDIPFSTHRHLGVSTGSGTSGGPTT